MQPIKESGRELDGEDARSLLETLRRANNNTDRLLAEREALRDAADRLIQRSAIDLNGGFSVQSDDWLALRKLTERPE